MSALVIQSDSLDVFENLAREEWLLTTQLAPSRAVLLLWRSRGAIVLGKNQNPWQECRPRRVEQAGLQLARRISGGGTVYHDEGNLNFALILPRALYDQSRQFAWVCAALRRLDIAAAEGRNHGLFVQERKISGNAFCLRGGGALHHGTLLWDADLERLHGLLGSPWDIRGRGIASQPAPVLNLRTLRPGLSLHDLGQALRESFHAAYGGPLTQADDSFFDRAAVAALRTKLTAWEWRFGLTPAFELRLPLPAGAGVLRLQVQHGLIEEVHVEGVPAAVAWVALAQRLKGERLDGPALAAALGNAPPELAVGVAEVRAALSAL